MYGTFIIIIDVLLRICDNQFRSCKITNIKMLDCDRVIKIEFEKKHFSYRAGQYVFIRFCDLAYFEFHPFSLSSYPDSGGACSVHIKSVGGHWTDKLAAYMKFNEGHDEWYKQIRVYQYEHVIFIGGGIGITPLHSMFNQLISDLLGGNIRRKPMTKSIHFVFTTR